ncbi:putative uncharacterized protein DDB_G0286901 [Chrysoperla carnea]|uniref:putative uncharacterized protein DDB_G0286901 n=1 Tax=Chrysoperla carnea TaxID=189513 RepID=UPI001D08C73F|nr:putative uncharacterized protein DDB_G0286901 [Chrysoperla carnea]
MARFDEKYTHGEISPNNNGHKINGTFQYTSVKHIFVNTCACVSSNGTNNSNPVDRTDGNRNDLESSNIRANNGKSNDSSISNPENKIPDNFFGIPNLMSDFTNNNTDSNKVGIIGNINEMNIDQGNQIKSNIEQSQENDINQIPFGTENSNEINNQFSNSSSITNNSSINEFSSMNDINRVSDSGSKVNNEINLGKEIENDIDQMLVLNENNDFPNTNLMNSTLSIDKNYSTSINPEIGTIYSDNNTTEQSLGNQIENDIDEMLSMNTTNNFPNTMNFITSADEVMNNENRSLESSENIPKDNMLPDSMQQSISDTTFNTNEDILQSPGNVPLDNTMPDSMQESVSDTTLNTNENIPQSSGNISEDNMVPSSMQGNISYNSLNVGGQANKNVPQSSVNVPQDNMMPNSLQGNVPVIPSNTVSQTNENIQQPSGNFSQDNDMTLISRQENVSDSNPNIDNGLVSPNSGSMPQINLAQNPMQVQDNVTHTAMDDSILDIPMNTNSQDNKDISQSSENVSRDNMKLKSMLGTVASIPNIDGQANKVVPQSSINVPQDSKMQENVPNIDRGISQTSGNAQEDNVTPNFMQGNVPNVSPNIDNPKNGIVSATSGSISQTNTAYNPIQENFTNVPPNEDLSMPSQDVQQNNMVENKPLNSSSLINTNLPQPSETTPQDNKSPNTTQGNFPNISPNISNQKNRRISPSSEMSQNNIPSNSMTDIASDVTRINNDERKDNSLPQNSLQNNFSSIFIPAVSSNTENTSNIPSQNFPANGINISQENTPLQKNSTSPTRMGTNPYANMGGSFINTNQNNLQNYNNQASDNTTWSSNNIQTNLGQNFMSNIGLNNNIEQTNSTSVNLDRTEQNIPNSLESDNISQILNNNVDTQNSLNLNKQLEISSTGSNNLSNLQLPTNSQNLSNKKFLVKQSEFQNSENVINSPKIENSEGGNRREININLGFGLTKHSNIQSNNGNNLNNGQINFGGKLKGKFEIDEDIYRNDNNVQEGINILANVNIKKRGRAS